ncbi:MAG: rRNA maturation RNase YbeY [Pseudomonadota bacterium]|nr:rRNA maturation RNase YbeY [Pseudomonadota bacterium]
MIDIQKVSNLDSLPENSSIVKWAKKALDKNNKEAEVVIRIVDIDESRKLNKTWCKKNYATNVLSFSVPESIEQAPNLLGDIVICANLVISEAKEQKKNIDAHCAHLVVHGILHLQGYEHNSKQKANVMESKEINILNDLGYNNPYEIRA